MRLVYLIGEPGCGKSTAVREAFPDTAIFHVERKPFAHTFYRNAQGLVEAIELGERRPPFSGTDCLSMSVQPKVMDWLLAARYEHSLVIGEGDRLGNAKFLLAVNELENIDLTVVKVETPTAVVKLRRRMRDGGGQNEAWVKGRQSKVEKLNHTLRANGVNVVTLDALPRPEKVGEALRRACGL